MTLGKVYLIFSLLLFHLNPAALDAYHLLLLVLGLARKG